MIFTHVPSRGVEEVGSPADRLLETLWSQYWAEPLAASLHYPARKDKQCRATDEGR
jgi:hypothetical protein